LSEALQVKLLRVLEDGTVRRVGENMGRRVDVRIFSATTRNLWADVEAGNFRRDLYYRLKGVVIRVPSLRERLHDIDLLLDYYFEVENSRWGKHVSLSEDARHLLLGYGWPGNVRELRHLVEALVASSRRSEVVCAERIREFLDSQHGDITLRCACGKTREDIRQVLRACGGNKSEAARILGISRRTLYRWMKDK